MRIQLILQRGEKRLLRAWSDSNRSFAVGGGEEASVNNASYGQTSFRTPVLRARVHRAVFSLHESLHDCEN